VYMLVWVLSVSRLVCLSRCMHTCMCQNSRPGQLPLPTIPAMASSGVAMSRGYWVITLAILQVAWAHRGHSGRVFLAADSSHLQYTGRHAMNGTQAMWQWQGTKVGMRLSCTSAINGTLEAHLRVPHMPDIDKYAWMLDGVQVSTVSLPASYQTPPQYMVASLDLSFGIDLIGEHTVELVKISEALSVPCLWSLADGLDPTTFEGFSLPAACRPLEPPTRPSRRLEFVGDSITCGFGNLAENAGDEIKCSVPPVGWRDYEDFTRAMPTLAGSAFGAEVHTECISQVGVMRNGDTTAKTTDHNISHYIHGALLTRHGAQWDYSSWTPDVLVVNLGTNDYDISQFLGLQPSYDHFQAHYTAFLKDLVSRYEGRLPALVVACGPMTTKQCPAVKQTSEAIATAFSALKVKYVDLRLPSSQLVCIWHPNVAGHHAMVEQLQPAIGELTGWAPGLEEAVLV